MKLIDNGPENLLFTWEIVIERRSGNACSGRDVRHARPLEAIAQKRRARTFEDAAPTVEGIVITVAQVPHILSHRSETVTTF